MNIIIFLVLIGFVFVSLKHYESVHAKLDRIIREGFVLPFAKESLDE